MQDRDIPEKINLILQQLINKYHPNKVILFGSYASGLFNEDSDLDFLIIKRDVPVDGIDRRWQLRKMVDTGGIPVDFLVVTPNEVRKRLQMNDPFLKNIIDEGKIMYSDKSYD